MLNMTRRAVLGAALAVVGAVQNGAHAVAFKAVGMMPEAATKSAARWQVAIAAAKVFKAANDLHRVIREARG